jgi:Na+/proline symporter
MSRIKSDTLDSSGGFQDIVHHGQYPRSYGCSSEYAPIIFPLDFFFGLTIISVIIATITVGVETKIDKTLIDSSGLTKPTLLGWQLLYILPVAVLTNDFFLSNFWIRTFASKTDKDLRIGVSIAAVVTLIILTLVGSTGLIATWSGAFDPNNPDQNGSVAFFYLLEQLPAWTVGIVLVMVVSLSTAAFDSFQSAMVSTASNDFFRNKLNIWWVRGGVVLIIFPGKIGPNSLSCLS